MTDLIDIREVSEFPRLEQYLGAWAMEEMAFGALYSQIGEMDLGSHLRTQAIASVAEPLVDAGSVVPGEVHSKADYEVTPEGVAVIEIYGTMLKYGSSLTSSAGTVAIRRQIQQAARAKGVNAIMLKIESPGGTVMGTRELALEVTRARQKKPVYAYIEDLGASAAYWVASQAEQIFANETARVGSIGTMAVVYDYSGRFARDGVKALLFRTGKFKGAGTPGTEINAEQQADFQRMVDDLNEFFVQGVASGRRINIEQVRELADGRVHLAKAAHGMRLIDGVMEFEEALGILARKQAGGRQATAVNNNPEEVSTMTGTQQQPPEQPRAATYEELKAELVGADAQFIVSQLDKKATLPEARGAWMAEQNARIERAKSVAKEPAPESKAKKPGVPPLGTGRAAVSSDDAETFEQKVEAEMSRNGGQRRRAVVSVARKYPDLHRAFLLETNPGKKQQALIEERFAE